jgi:hypothetical protein
MGTTNRRRASGHARTKNYGPPSLEFLAGAAIAIVLAIVKMSTPLFFVLSAILVGLVGHLTWRLMPADKTSNWIKVLGSAIAVVITLVLLLPSIEERIHGTNEPSTFVNSGQ